MYRNIQLRSFRSLRPSRLSPAAWLTFSYLLLSSMWILLSDRAAANIAGDNDALFARLQEFKGIFFVLLSGFLLYLLSRKLYNNIHDSYKQQLNTEERMLALNEAAGESIFEYDFNTGKTRVNERMKSFLPTAEMENKKFLKILNSRIHPDDRERVNIEFNEVINQKKGSWQTELKLIDNDNRCHVMLSNTCIIRNEFTKRPEQLVGTMMDISELRNLQKNYYEQQLKHKKILATSIIKAQENERNRWAIELHDNVCQLLSVANMYTADICSNPEKAAKLAPEVKNLLMSSVNEIRQLSACIKTHSFAKETLQELIEKLEANINRVKPIQFELDAKEFDETKVTSEQKLMIYRVVQEQFNNITKYAEATKVEVKLSTASDEDVHITVKDDGKGFDPSKVKAGIGLRNIQSRLNVYGGNLRIQSAPGQGCTLIATFKLNND